jgi:hypothetical protein
MNKLIPITTLSLSIAFALSGCDTPGQSAGLGAAAGALFGAAASGGRPGAVLQGAAIGAGTGYVVGKIVQHDRREREEYDDQDPNYRDRDDDRGDYHGDTRDGLPMGRPTRHDGFVISPYPPHNRIDVRGIPSGAKVMDPSVNRVFINP